MKKRLLFYLFLALVPISTAIGVACAYNKCCTYLTSAKYKYGTRNNGNIRCYKTKGGGGACSNAYKNYDAYTCQSVAKACPYCHPGDSAPYTLCAKGAACAGIVSSSSNCSNTCSGTPELTGYGGGIVSFLLLFLGMLCLRFFWRKGPAHTTQTPSGIT